MLTFGPLAPALAAGNTAVIKPSELSAATSALIADLVPKYLDTEAVAVVEGAIPETTALLEQRWHLIFFTGSPQVGKIIHQAAAKHLTPTVLELGGKNPTIVHSSANIVWPDVKDAFVEHLVETVHEFYGDDPQRSPDYGRIVNRKSTERLAGLLKCGKAPSELPELPSSAEGPISAPYVNSGSSGRYLRRYPLSAPICGSSGRLSAPRP